MKRTICVLSFLLLLAAINVADASAWQTAEDSQEKEESERRSKFLDTTAQGFSLFSKDRNQSFVRSEQPILRYSNPTRERGSTHGSTYLWLDGQQPIAACSYSIRRPDDLAMYEFTLLKAPLVECRQDETIIWRPQSPAAAPKPLEKAFVPSQRKNQRLLQMRAMARQFDAVCTRRSGEASQLRLLPQPLYRYENKAAGVIDGALFGFVISNDPELLLQVEAVMSADGKTVEWKYAFSRMTSLQVDVKLDKETAWQVPNFYEEGRSDSKPYLEGRFGTYIGEEQLSPTVK